MQHIALDHDSGAELLTVSVVARALRVSEGNVRRLERCGALPCIRAGQMRLFRYADVAHLAEMRAAAISSRTP